MRAEREWIEAGFCFIAGGAAPRIVTVSGCVVDVIPDVWALPWAEADAPTLLRMREILEIDESGLADLRSWVSRALDRGDFGWPNVLLSLSAAREFESRYLRSSRPFRLVGLSLERSMAEEFVREEDDDQGVRKAISRGVPLGRGFAPLGFDVLGRELGGWFHTFSCNGLERDFSEKLGVSFNEHGLIPDFGNAVAAAAYANRDDVGAEPVGWYPFRLDDYGRVGSPRP